MPKITRLMEVSGLMRQLYSIQLEQEVKVMPDSGPVDRSKVSLHIFFSAFLHSLSFSPHSSLLTLYLSPPHPLLPLLLLSSQRTHTLYTIWFCLSSWIPNHYYYKLPM